jgi:hypothetical protein
MNINTTIDSSCHSEKLEIYKWNNFACFINKPICHLIVQLRVLLKMPASSYANGIIFCLIYR